MEKISWVRFLFKIKPRTKIILAHIDNLKQ